MTAKNTQERAGETADHRHEYADSGEARPVYLGHDRGGDRAPDIRLARDHGEEHRRFQQFRREHEHRGVKKNPHHPGKYQDRG